MHLKIINRVLLGLLMLVPGLMKLFVMKPAAVSGFLDSLGFPASMFFAWVLIILEIVSGAMILANWKVEYAVWAPIVILLVALVTTTPWSTPGQIKATNVLFHLVAISGYVMLWKGGRMAEMSRRR